jgi:hypothetical protein
MGMDVSGKNASAPVGEYFRNNVWNWHPLADYIQAAHPDLAEKCPYWHSNDGGGLDADDAAELGKRLRADLASGRVKAFADANHRPAPNGQLTREMIEKNEYPYYFTAENVEKFAAFVEASGGFEIW